MKAHATKPSVLALLTIGCVCALATTAHAQTLITIAAGDSRFPNASPGIGNEANRDPVNAINGSGLSLNGFGQLQHSNLANNTSWNVTQQTAGYMIDLGSVQTVGYLQIWNFNDFFTSFGPQTFDLWASTTPEAGLPTSLANFTQVLNNQALDLADNTPAYLGETFLFSGATLAGIPSVLGDNSGSPTDLSGTNLTARYLFFGDLTGDSLFGGRVGLSEVQLYTTPVPEPSSAAMLVGAFAALAFLQRCRRRLS